MKLNKEIHYDEALELFNSVKVATSVAKELCDKYGIEYDENEGRKLRNWLNPTLNLPLRSGDPEFAPKILIYDIETSLVEATLWWTGKQYVGHNQLRTEPKIITIAYKWAGEDTVTVLNWDKKQSDKKLMKDFLEVYNQADMVIGQNCMEKHSKILTSDLKWVEAHTLKVGDKLLAFDENGTDRCNGGRQYKESIVTHNEIIEKDLYEVSLSNGDVIKVTEEHPWLTTNSHTGGNRWLETKNFNKRGLKTPTKVIKMFNVWEEDMSKEAGYLAGFFDGEGTMTQTDNVTMAIGACQLSGQTWNTVKNNLTLLNIPFVDRGIVAKTKALGRPCNYLTLLGGKRSCLEFIGKIRPQKFLERFSIEKLKGIKTQYKETPYVLSVKYIGKGEVASLSTTTHTYIGEGYAMHNCDRFDNRFVNARAMKYNLDVNTYVKSFDIMKQTKRLFRLPSYSMDYITKYLGIQGKLGHTGRQMWEDIQFGSQKVAKAALKLMSDYNIQDVLATEEMYTKLRKYMGHITHLGVLSGESKVSCPNCGGHNLRLLKTTVTSTGVIQRIMQCKDDKVQFKMSNRDFLKLSIAK